MELENNATATKTEKEIKTDSTKNVSIMFAS